MHRVSYLSPPSTNPPSFLTFPLCDRILGIPDLAASPSPRALHHRPEPTVIGPPRLQTQTSIIARCTRPWSINDQWRPTELLPETTTFATL